MQHCAAFFNKKTEEKLYRIYVTDALKIIAKNTAQFAGGSELKIRYAELIDRSPPEERTEEEIINRLKEKLKSIK